MNGHWSLPVAVIEFSYRITRAVERGHFENRGYIGDYMQSRPYFITLEFPTVRFRSFNMPTGVGVPLNSEGLRPMSAATRKGLWY